MSMNIEQIVEAISAMSIVECAELSKALEEKFGVSASMMAAPSAGGATSAAAVEEKSEFKVELIEGGPEKKDTIKALRLIKKDMGLIEAKKAVESAPFVIAEAATKEEAASMKKIMEEVGAKVKLS